MVSLKEDSKNSAELNSHNNMRLSGDRGRTVHILQAEIAAHSSSGCDSGEHSEGSREIDKRRTVDCCFLVQLYALDVVLSPFVLILHCFSCL